MDADFWHERWQEGKLGFHQQEVNPHLLTLRGYLPAPGSRVLVPLCGKSVDMAYLAREGYQVTGVELSPIAAAAFFEERGVTPAVETIGPYTRFAADGVEILQGDVMQLRATHLGPVTAVWDRAALVALPEAMRARYIETVGALLPSGSPYLLVTFDIPGRETGPPFSVSPEAVSRLFAGTFDVVSSERVALDSPGDPFHGEQECRVLLRRC